MRYTIEQLQSDVMARLGEIARPPFRQDMEDIPWPEDVLALRIRSLIPEVGARLIREAPACLLGTGIPIDAEVTMRRMPCGLFAAELALPDGFLRLVSVRMTGWRRSAVKVIAPDSAQWECQWSAEPGIAGCPDRPRAYLDGGNLLLLGSPTSDTLDHLRIWKVPQPDASATFDFPAPLYPALTASLSPPLKS